ncbi:MAG: DUF4358 domain-containing protein [Ruthenibacterium sp.]
MKKMFSVFLCLCCLTALVTACGKSGADYDMNKVLADVEAAAPIANPLAFTDDDLVYDMSIDKAMVDSYVGHRTGVNGASGAVLVLKTTDGNVDTVKAQFETYCKNTAAFLANYPEFAAAQKQAEQGRVVAKGNYLVLAIAGEGTDYAAVDTAIADALK